MTHTFLAIHKHFPFRTMYTHFLTSSEPHSRRRPYLWYIYTLYIYIPLDNAKRLIHLCAAVMVLSSSFPSFQPEPSVVGHIYEANHKNANKTYTYITARPKNGSSNDTTTRDLVITQLSHIYVECTITSDANFCPE